MKNKIVIFLAVILILLGISFLVVFNYFYALAIAGGIVIGAILSYLIFKNPFLGILLIVFFLPFERIPNIDIGGMSIKINQIIGGITLVAFILSVLVNRKKITSNALIWPIIIFWTTMIISLFFSSYIPRSLIVLVFVIFTSSFAILFNQYVTDKNHLEKIILVLFWSSLTVGVFGIYQFLGDIVGLPNEITGLREAYSKGVFGFPRVQAFSIEPLYLGNYLMIPLGIFLALYFAKIQIKYLTRPILLGMILLVTVILLLTFSRGAYLALAVLTAVIFVFMAKKIFSVKIIVSLIVVCLLSFFALNWFLNQGEDRSYDEFIERITLADAAESESVNGRLIEYENALKLAENNYVFGIGIGSYGTTKKLSDYADPADLSVYDIVNNQYIELLTETGYVGLGAYALMAIALIWRSIIAFYKTKNEMIKYILIGFFAAYMATLVQYNFFSTLYIIHIWVLMGLLLAMQNMALDGKYEKNN